MRNVIILIFNFIFFLNSFAQQKNEKPPKPGKDKINNVLPNKTGNLVLSLGKLKQNKDDLYCWEIDGKCNIIDGKITLYSPIIAKGDNASVTERLYAEGEFLEGKHHGIWKYYNENRKVIKKEKWDNGKLIYRKEFK